MGDTQLVIDIPALSRLSRLEDTIERGLNTFVEVGAALLEIREGGLYRGQYATFEDYCRERWGMSRQNAHELIGAFRVSENLSGIPDTPSLGSVSQSRPLTSLPPETQREAWQRAVETAPKGNDGQPKMTAKIVKQAVEEVKGTMAVHFSSETPEWNTPPAIIEKVLQVLGAIDLDPCSDNKNHPNVTAKYHFTVEDNGLGQPWIGKVYMNPPYGREIDDWVEKLCNEYEKGGVDEAIALVPARTDTKWWYRFRDYPICFVYGRLKFGSAENSAPFPSALVYLGSEIDRFYYAFYDIGDIWQKIEPGMFGE